MDLKEQLINNLSKYKKVVQSKVIFKEYKIDNKSFDFIEYKLIGQGMILEENKEQNSIVIKIQSGILNRNPAYISLITKENKLYLAAFANEGILSQNTSKKAIIKIINRLNLEEIK